MVFLCFSRCRERPSEIDGWFLTRFLFWGVGASQNAGIAQNGFLWVSFGFTFWFYKPKKHKASPGLARPLRWPRSKLTPLS